MSARRVSLEFKLRDHLALRSQREVAAMLGCTPQWVNFLEQRAFRKLRNSRKVKELYREL